MIRRPATCTLFFLCLALPAVGSAAPATAAIEVASANTLEFPLPNLPTSFYLQLGSAGFYTPDLSDGRLILEYSMSVRAAISTESAGFHCPDDRPKPILRVALASSSRDGWAQASIVGSTTDPQTGDDLHVDQTTGQMLVPDISQPDIQVLRVCGPSSGPPPGNSPPQASFTSKCSDLDCAFVDASNDPDGDVVAWRWEFGDGEGSGEQYPGHRYAQAGRYTVTLAVTDQWGATGRHSRDVTVFEPLAVTTTSMPNGTTGREYSASLVARGGAVPYSWALASGTLPPGMALQATGVIEGRAQKPGTYSFTVEVKDSRATPGSARGTLSVTVKAGGPPVRSG